MMRGCNYTCKFTCSELTGVPNCCDLRYTQNLARIWFKTV